MRPRLAPWTSIVPVAVLVVVATFYFAQSARVCFHFPLDDAWIHQVYARSLATGHGFDYNPGHAEAGSTSPLWSIVSAPTHWIEAGGSDAVVLAVKLLALAFAAASVVLLARVVGHVTGSPVIGATAATLFALEPRLYFSALSGMENTLLVALWLGALATYLRGPLWVSGVLVSLAPLCRPEAVLLLPAWIAGVLLLPADRAPRRGRGAALVLIAVPSLAWCVFCRRVTGHWLPNTFYEKAHLHGLGSGLRAMLAVLTLHGYATALAFWGGLAAMIVVCCRRASRRARFAMLAGLVALPLAYAIGVALSRTLIPEGYYWTRWEDPASLLLTGAACTGLAATVVPAFSALRARDWASAMARARLAAGAVAFALFVFAIPPLLRDTFALRLKLDSDAFAIETNNEDVGRWLAENTPPGSVIGLNDAGAIRYFDDRESLDVIGLNDHRIAFGEMSHAQYLGSIDWFVGFPAIAKEIGVASQFEAVHAFSVPYERFTICPCPGQVEMVIYRRRVPRPSRR